MGFGCVDCELCPFYFLEFTNKNLDIFDTLPIVISFCKFYHDFQLESIPSGFLIENPTKAMS